MTAGKTDANLQVALAGEADANRRYLAYGIQALNEGHPEVAQLFFEAAGAETVHALSHLRTLGAIGSTRDNLVLAATGEVEEIEVVYPRMIREAEQEGRLDAAASFRLALDREKHHRDMFRRALEALDRGGRPASPATARAVAATTSGDADGAAAPRADAAMARPPASAGRSRGVEELETELERIERLSGIRELVFGAQDGLVSTFAVVAGLAAAGGHNVTVFLAGAMSVIAGVLSMSVGTFLSSRAQRQVYEAELELERGEIRQSPGEEAAELVAALMARGMSRPDAAEVTRRVARYPGVMLDVVGVFELGLAPQRLGTPVRDAFVMAAAFAAGGLTPLLPFLLPARIALPVSALASVAALFLVGALKARLARISIVRSGLEVVVLGVGSGLVGFAIGRLASIALGVDLG
jgi:VIT1/CCC1 family predicted Fe2+/Mn2+ transporter/rubrerythrin